MQTGYELRIILRSDGTFGKGGGLPGRLDTEVEHDTATGLPYVRGRVVKGLLVEACGTVVQSLRQQPSPALPAVREAAAWLFGREGSRAKDAGKLHIHRAQLPRPLREAVERDVERAAYTPEAARDSLTAVRHQTAISDETGAPDKGSLRNRRVLLRETRLTAPLSFGAPPDEDALAILHASARLMRRGGLRRSRGGTRLQTRLADSHHADGVHERRFVALVRGKNAT